MVLVVIINDQAFQRIAYGFPALVVLIEYVPAIHVAVLINDKEHLLEMQPEVCVLHIRGQELPHRVRQPRCGHIPAVRQQRVDLHMHPACARDLDMSGRELELQPVAPPVSANARHLRFAECAQMECRGLKDIQHDMSDEEVLNLLADSKISESPATEKYTLGQRAADAIAKFAGSWAFIFAFTGVLILWMVINTILAADAFDPFPFILLNLVLSCVAAIQAPLIMMSQNRQEEKDRRRAENDYKVNLKTEIMIEDLYDKVNAILAKQSALEKKLLEQEEKQPKP